MTRCRSMQRGSPHGAFLAFMGAGAFLMAWAGPGFTAEESVLAEHFDKVPQSFLSLLDTVSKIFFCIAMFAGAISLLLGRFDTVIPRFMLAIFALFIPKVFGVAFGLSSQAEWEPGDAFNPWTYFVFGSVFLVGLSGIIRYLISGPHQESVISRSQRDSEAGVSGVALAPPPLKEVAVRSMEPVAESSAAGTTGEVGKPQPGKRKIILD